MGTLDAAAALLTEATPLHAICPETNAAIEWIKHRKRNKPWMATVSFSAAHAPLQQPPAALLAAGSVPSGGLDCTQTPAQRVLMDQILEAMDHEVGRLLTEIGLATRTSDGNLNFHPETTNTMVIVLGDNGSFASTVKAPFNPLKAKASVYQTGVWVPLIVAGPLVNSPDREVLHRVNVVDLFQLFGEIAGLDVRRVVPRSHILDSASVLPYLTNPHQSSIRTRLHPDSRQHPRNRYGDPTLRARTVQNVRPALYLGLAMHRQWRYMVRSRQHSLPCRVPELLPGQDDGAGTGKPHHPARFPDGH